MHSGERQQLLVYLTTWSEGDSHIIQCLLPAEATLGGTFDAQLLSLKITCLIKCCIFQGSRVLPKTCFVSLTLSDPRSGFKERFLPCIG